MVVSAKLKSRIQYDLVKNRAAHRVLTSFHSNTFHVHKTCRPTGKKQALRASILGKSINTGKLQLEGNVS